MAKRTKKLATNPSTHTKSNLAQLKREMQELPFNIQQRTKSYYSVRESGFYGKSRKATTAAFRNAGGNSPVRRRKKADQ